MINTLGREPESTQGRGYASESARAILTLLGRMGVSEITAFIHPDHAASTRVATAIGMEPTKTWENGKRAWQLTNIDDAQD